MATRFSATRPVGAVLVLFIDQLEELFTLVPSWRRHAFGELLARAAEHRRLLVLTTLRADFLPEYAAEPALSALLQTDAFVLGPPGPAALVDMIRRPAELAGLVLEEGLVDGILRDAAGEPGEALPLVAFCLEELYRRKTPGRHITLQAYHRYGRVAGRNRAAGRRAPSGGQGCRVGGPRHRPVGALPRPRPGRRGRQDGPRAGASGGAHDCACPGPATRRGAGP